MFREQENLLILGSSKVAKNVANPFHGGISYYKQVAFESISIKAHPNLPPLSKISSSFKVGLSGIIKEERCSGLKEDNHWSMEAVTREGERLSEYRLLCISPATFSRIINCRPIPSRTSSSILRMHSFRRPTVLVQHTTVNVVTKNSKVSSEKELTKPLKFFLESAGVLRASVISVRKDL
ncbi:hypothetical protein VNO77_41991 [Canavalia gladiata]|uniref:Uncharacterized protein n=1 Tax=Canavalia gladiata TaxID=3824 RepID=A0AAN9PSG3_CANGL